MSVTRSFPWLSGLTTLVQKGLNNPTSIETKKLLQICGLKRSGLHAVSFWILNHCESHAFINNSPIKRKGDGSRMSRTVRDSPLPYIASLGEEVSMFQDSIEISAPLPEKVDLLGVLFQSQFLHHLNQYQPLVRNVEAESVQTVLILRDPFNWAASYMQKSQSPQDVENWPEMWKEYAKEFLGITNYLSNKIVINYNKWFVDEAYRRLLSEELGYEFTDLGLNIVTPHAGGSSFDKTNFDRNAQAMKVLDRWKEFQNNPNYRAAFQKHADIIDIAEKIFDFSPELAQFVQSLK